MIYAVVVLYNKKCDESMSVQSLTMCKNIRLIVFDNSNADYRRANAEICRKNHWLYDTLNCNAGLSRAYNYVLDTHSFQDDDYIMMLDDDTELSESYLREVMAVTAKRKAEVFLPVVFSNQAIISPCNLKYGYTAKKVRALPELKRPQITAINSGMVIAARVFRRIRYDEGLFLDYVDHDFMAQVRKKGISVRILRSSLNQNFSRDQKGSLDGTLHRFRIYKKDLRHYCRKYGIMPFYYCNIGKFAAENCLRYRTAAFLKPDAE